MNEVKRLPTYKEEVAQYTKKDAVHALLFGVFLTLMFTAIWGVFMATGLRDSDGRMTITGQVVNIAFLVPMFLITLFVFLKKKGQTLRSIGLHLMDWKKALVVGLFFAVVLSMIFDGLVPGLLGGWQMHSAGMVAWLLVMFLILAFYEDVMYIGYIQTRIYGLIKNDYLAVFIGGLIFAVTHWPFFITMAIVSGDGFGTDFWGAFAFATVTWIVMHIIMNTIFRHLRSIITVTLFHFAWNFAFSGHFWVDGYENGFNPMFSGAIAFGAVFLVTGFLQHLEKRKAAVV